jgi:ELWxxDGT repeat protein
MAFTPIGTRLYFSASDGSTGYELWAHETSNSTTWRATDINPGSGNSLSVDQFGIVGTRLYFSAWDGSSGYELWAHEITNASTWRVADINSGSGSSYPWGLTTIGTRLYFSAEEGVGCGGGGGGPGGGCGIELMAHDTVNGSTWMIADINVGADDSEPQWLTVIGPRLFFGAYDGTDEGLWGLIIESTPAY